MPVFGPTKRQDLIRGLRQFGFDGPYASKRHQFMLKGALRLRIPNPHQGSISADLMAELLRQGGISREEWERI
jgi:hypothetical protein